MYWRSLVTFVLALLVSSSSIVYALYVSGHSSDAARGGSVVVALSFLFLFLGNGVSARVYDILTHEVQELDRSLAPSEAKALSQRIRLQRDEEQQKNVLLAISSATGTLFWGFGDVIACKIAGLLTTVHLVECSAG